MFTLGVLMNKALKAQTFPYCLTKAVVLPVFTSRNDTNQRLIGQNKLVSMKTVLIRFSFGNKSSQNLIETNDNENITMVS